MPCKRKAGKAGRQDSRDTDGAAIRYTSGILPGASLPFAGMARSHKLSFVEWSERCSGPWRFRCPVSGAMVVPGGTYLARDGQMRAPRDGLSDPGRHHHCTASPIRSTEHWNNKSLWDPAGKLRLPFAGGARSNKKKVHRGLAGTPSLRSGAQVWVTPFRERREPVPGGSLSNVLFSRVPEGRHPDPLSSEPRRHGPLQRSVNRGAGN